MKATAHHIHTSSTKSSPAGSAIPQSRASTSAVRSEPRAIAHADLGLGLGLIALGLGLAVLSLLGPLALDVIDYRVSETLRNQTIGLDLISLVLVAPVAIGVGVLALKRHAAAPLLALGPSAYAVYMLIQYVLGPEYLRLPGNNERFFLLYLVLFVLGGALGIRAWSTVDLDRIPTMPRRRARLLGGVVLPIAGVVVFARYIPALLDVTSSQPQAGDYKAGPTFFWTIALLDLGIGLPTLIAASVGLLRDRAWAPKALYVVVGWLALVGPAVAAMAISMYVHDDPNASLGLVALMTTLGIGLAALAAFLCWPLLRTSPDQIFSSKTL
jgi:hypothetical protein